MVLLLYLTFRDSEKVDWVESQNTFESAFSKETVYSSIRVIEKTIEDEQVQINQNMSNYKGGYPAIYWLSGKYESSGDPSSAGSDNGHAYGLFQMDGRYSLAECVTYIYSKNPTTFSMLEPYSHESSYGDGREWRFYRNNTFNSVWKAAYNASPKEFTVLQMEFTKSLYFDSRIPRIKKDLGFDPTQRSEAVQASLLSVINWWPESIAALKRRGINASSTDEVIIHTLYDACNARSAFPRWNQERADSLAILNGTFNYKNEPKIMNIINILGGEMT